MTYRFSKRRTLDFTLVEILVVVGIMMLLMAIAMPAFDAMTSGSGISAGGREVAQTLKLARAYSISNRQYVALVFPMYGKDWDKSKDDDDTPYTEFKGYHYPDLSESKIDDVKYYNRAYRPCVVEKYYDRFDHPHYKFKYWIPGEKWRFLPKGIAVVGMGDNALARMGCITATDPTPEYGAPYSVRYFQNPILSVNFTDIGGDRVGDDYENQKDFTPGVIFSPAGKNGGRNCDIVMGEATYTGNDLLLTNLDKESWGTITVNDRGKVTYLPRRRTEKEWGY